MKVKELIKELMKYGDDIDVLTDRGDYTLDCSGIIENIFTDENEKDVLLNITII